MAKVALDEIATARVAHAIVVLLSIETTPVRAMKHKVSVHTLNRMQLTKSN
jgi:hypothetical protein